MRHHTTGKATTMKMRAWILTIALMAACARQGAVSRPAGASAPPPASPSPGYTITTVVPLEIRPGWSARQRDSAMAILEGNRRRWNAVRPPHYRYWQEGRCFCAQFWPGPRVITILDGRVVGASNEAGTLTDSAFIASAAGQPAGLDALFDRVARSVRDTTIDAVRVDYDAQRGFPARIVFDPSVFTSDDEYTLVVSHYEVLATPPAGAPRRQAPRPSAGRPARGAPRPVRE